MPNQPIRDRLRAFFASPLAAGYAQMVPLSLLAAGIGTTLGAVIALPAFATSGLGIVLGGVAVNLASGLIQQIIDAPDDTARGKLVQQGIKQGDPDVTALAASTLAYAGPDLVPALPDTQRDTLLSALDDGLREAGGSLEALAPRLLAALRDPAADWAALRADLVGDVTTLRQVQEAANMIRSHQHAEGAARRVEQIQKATGSITDSSQTYIGRRSPMTPAEQPQPLAATLSEPEHIRALLDVRRHNLQYLELREARAGGSAPVELVNALRDERTAIAMLEQRLNTGGT